MANFAIHSRLFALVLWLCAPLSQVWAQDYQLTVDEKVIVVGDIHGDFATFTDLIKRAGLVDSELNWTAGKSHFVSVGDLIDRGPESRKIIDLFMRLEAQANTAGGAIHLVIGNHEHMNLISDLRYLNNKDYQDYLEDEDPTLRDTYLQQFINTAQTANNTVSTTDLQAQFTKLYPPGYFGHQKLFGLDGKYGKWLLSKPSALVINNTLFVHGGVSSELPLISLRQLNQQASDAIRRYVRVRKDLLTAMPFYLRHTAFENNERLAAVIQDQDAHIQRQYNTFVDIDKSYYFSGQSHYWYRGSALCHPIYEQQITERVLNHFGATRLVIGHTPTLSRTIESRMHGKVLSIDTGLFRDYYQGNAMLLALDGERIEQFDGKTWQPFTIDNHPHRHQYKQRNYTAWESALKQANVINSRSVTIGNSEYQQLQLEHQGETFYGLFNQKHSNNKSYRYDVAAYRVARAMALGIIPPTVIREVDGRKGALQLRIDKSFSEARRLKKGYMPSEDCVIAYQANLMTILDYLFYNLGRNQDNITYTGDWLMWLVDHSESFRPKSNAPKALREQTIAYSPQLQQRLSDLNFQQLKVETAGLLSDAQIKAVLKRRDWLLSRW
ncbi:metallophosphoesterase [Thalassotalea ponticola]|uniref:metallophosphoesterase n=1 Tax=Thalassotalea ponticola TaxID=1523392 RepID=UPI0025B60CBC|nr:metallophosphoesterase [Thalassotalea ponticola]MDN3651985.1 metallophosphoesterase [Thalassotalea ponticola]